LGKYLWLSTLPLSLFPAPMLLLSSSNRHHCSFSLGDFLIHRYRLHHSWIGLNLLCICLCHFVAGGHLLAGFLETLCFVIDACHDVFDSCLIPLWPYGLCCNLHLLMTGSDHVLHVFLAASYF
jgi:hypothetical protein